MKKRMRWALASSILVALTLTPAFAAAQESEDARVTSAKEWLALVDAGDYAESWERAGETFRSQVAKETWEQQLTAVRTPLGATGSREFQSTQELKDPPSAPPGDYLVITFATSFEGLAAATETVVLAKEGEDDWKVAGYFIQ